MSIATPFRQAPRYRSAISFKVQGAPFIDAGIIGLAPNKSSGTRFYVSGPDTSAMEALDGKGFKVISLGAEIGKASAMKMAYAGLTKGSWTLWTSVLLTAEQNGLLMI